MSPIDARRETDLAKAELESSLSRLTAVCASGAYVDLDYETVEDYLTAEIGPIVSQYSSSLKRQLIHDLHEAGFKQREIAAATGVAQPNISRELKPKNIPVGRSDAPIAADPNMGEVIDAEIVVDVPIIYEAEFVHESKPPRNVDRDVALVNDVRLYLRTLKRSPRITGLTEAGRQYIIDALRDAADTIEGI